MNEQEKIASEVFQQHGLNFKDAKRAGGWTNAVWLNGGVVLRVSLRKNSDIIRREVMRSKMLPPSVGYPKNIDVGVTDGYEWSLSEHIQGDALSEVWHNLSWEEKTKAVKQISHIMNAVHSVDIGKVEQITLKVAWYSSFNKNDSIADIQRYESQNIFTNKQNSELQDILERFYRWNTSTTPVLCHGDITTDNLLWREGNVISLLDFEHSAITPQQLDVHSLVNLALIHYDEATSTDIILLNDKNHEIKQYVTEMISLFSPYLSSQSDKDLFMGYSVLFRLRFLDFWLENPKGNIEQCDAYQMLLSLCDGSSGYFSDLLK